MPQSLSCFSRWWPVSECVWINENYSFSVRCVSIYGTIFLECCELFSRLEQEIEVWEMSRDQQWKILKDGWIWIWCRKTSEIIPRNWLISIKSDGRKLKNAVVIRNKMVFIPLPILNWSSHGEVRQRTNSSIFPSTYIHT